MRWKFLNAANPDDAKYRQSILKKIDCWWQAFAAKTEDLDALFNQRKKWDLPLWMEKHLQSISENLMWEFGPEPDVGGHHLVITPESCKYLRPLVETMLERAPKIPNWAFYAYRKPIDFHDAIDTVKARTGGDISAVRIQARRGELHLIDLVYSLPERSFDEEEQRSSNAFVATECLLGEETLDRWIGLIEVSPKDEDRSFLVPDRLVSTVKALIQSVIDQLPEQPCFKFFEDSEYFGIQAKPESDDHGGHHDLIAATTLLPDVLMNGLSGRPFFSGRFSKFGERFCFLKIDGEERPKGAEVDYRTKIEDAINESLVPAELGCCIGGGTGVRYSYIYLALTNVLEACKVVKQALQKCKVSRRTWILFFDSDWEHEWIGAWDETPEPPMEW